LTKSVSSNRTRFFQQELPSNRTRFFQQKAFLMEPKHDRPSPPPSGDEGSRDEGAGDDEASRDAAGDVTQLLQARRAGDDEAGERLWGEVYDRLRRIAHRRLQRERDAPPSRRPIWCTSAT
jgi:hypothetical protein